MLKCLFHVVTRLQIHFQKIRCSRFSWIYQYSKWVDSNSVDVSWAELKRPILHVCTCPEFTRSHITFDSKNCFLSLFPEMLYLALAFCFPPAIHFSPINYACDCNLDLSWLGLFGTRRLHPLAGVVFLAAEVVEVWALWWSRDGEMLWLDFMKKAVALGFWICLAGHLR